MGLLTMRLTKTYAFVLIMDVDVNIYFIWKRYRNYCQAVVLVKAPIPQKTPKINKYSIFLKQEKQG